MANIKLYIKTYKVVIVYAILFFSSINIYSQEMAIPVNLQAALFKKILSFDKTLSAKSNYEITVLVGNSSGDEIVKAFNDAGLNAKSVSGDQVPDGAFVIYVMPGVITTKSQSASKGVLSISGVESYIESGNVAVGLGLEGGKPKIIVHMEQLKAENHEMSANLLKLAKVIK